jgi:3-phenylpropionate/trans-cinnamate dioxygenase ferredoxin subunit
MGLGEHETIALGDQYLGGNLMVPQNQFETESNKFDYIDIGTANELDNGDRLFVEIDGLAIVVFNILGQLFAIGDVCSHDDGPLGDGELNGHEVICPRHGAKFDVQTGKAISLPAVVNIPSYPVRVRDGQIEVGLPTD